MILFIINVFEFFYELLVIHFKYYIIYKKNNNNTLLNNIQKIIEVKLLKNGILLKQKIELKQLKKKK